MTVYVDDAFLPFGRMHMSHMFADSHAELVAMADIIGVARKWIQYPGTYREHFDICRSKRLRALANGARECDIEFWGNWKERADQAKAVAP